MPVFDKSKCHGAMPLIILFEVLGMTKQTGIVIL